VHALGIDVGSTNVKAVVLDDEGRSVGGGEHPLATRRAGGIAEQGADEIWRATSAAIARATAAAGGAAADIATVVCCSQYSSIVPVDRDGRPIADLVMYWDQRGGDDVVAILGAYADAFETWLDRHAIPPVGPGLSLAHILHFQHERPEVHAATAAYLEPMDYVNLRLTGRVAANQCTMFTSLLCDNRRLGTTEYDADLVRMAGVDHDRLPPLVALDAIVGEVQPRVADELGLPAGVPVYAAVNDSHACALATGVDTPGRGAAIVGTTSVMLDTIGEKKATDLDHEVLPMPSPLPGRYVVWAENGIGGKALEHVLHRVVYATDHLGSHLTGREFEHLDAVVASVPAGSRGAMFLPWLSGSLSPRSNPLMRGGFLNLSLDTGRAEMVRAVTEGIALNLRWLLPAVEAFAGSPMEEVVFGGGAARSAPWAQIMADVLDRPVRPLAEPDRAAARGAALLALVRAGAMSFDDLSAHVATGATLEPDAAHRGQYDRLFAQFVAAFEATRPISEALNASHEAQDDRTP
jgi:xylulokinase